MQEGKIVVEEALQISEKEDKRKAKEKRKVYPSEFQTTKRDKKGFLSEQCKEIEENNKMRQTKDTKGTFHAKMSTIKYRNGMD